MKKFLIVLAIIIAANIGCKKIDIDGGGLCACSPISNPSFSLVIKNAAGADLLNSKTPGSFAINQIQLYQLESNGTKKNINFSIRPPFSYGTDQYVFYQIYSEQIVALATSATSNFYLKLGDNREYKLNLQFSTTSGKVEKLLIDDVQANIETGSVANYSYSKIFFLEL
jgi:hypothetical protein